MNEDIKALARQFIDEVMNEGQLGKIGEFYAHNAAEITRDVTLIRTAFSDLNLVVEEQIAEGDKVATRWTATGTHSGPMFGRPPTGRQVSWTGLVLNRYASGKIISGSVVMDRLGIMEQLNVSAINSIVDARTGN